MGISPRGVLTVPSRRSFALNASALYLKMDGSVKRFWSNGRRRYHSSWIRMRINWSGFGDYTGKRIWE
jgi:hypothetical protein